MNAPILLPNHKVTISADEDGKFSIGFRVTFNRSHSPTKLKVTCRVAKVTTDEIECSIDDPDQAKSPL